jgi:hypothetical protein
VVQGGFRAVLARRGRIRASGELLRGRGVFDSQRRVASCWVYPAFRCRRSLAKLCTQTLSTQALNRKGNHVSTMKTKDGVEQSRRLDAAALLECRTLAATALLLVGIGFWQHYTGYVEAEQRRDASVTTAPESASGSTAARWPNMAEAIEHANIHPQVSDISSVTANIDLSSHRPRTASAGPVPWEQHSRSTSKPWLVP